MSILNDNFKWEMCEYSIKKRNMLNKHVNTKHNECKKNLLKGVPKFQRWLDAYSSGACQEYYRGIYKD